MQVRVNGIDIGYDEGGEGPPLILLHGNGEDRRIFDRLIWYLQDEHKIYAIDTRGHGESGKVEIFHYADMVEDVAAFIKELKIERPILYGFSDGGIVGLMLASKYPRMLSGLVASGPNLTPKGLKLSARLPMRIKNIFWRDPLIDLMVREPNITDGDLQKIEVPVLITIGENDAIPVSHARHIADKIPDGSLLIVPGEGHSSYIVHSDKLYPLISGFVEHAFASDKK
ncbi:MAG: alpha/beta hydrolase [Methanomassiliicoccaceae archaeon]|nr:alpha/beta hydrolase [Methanomassiliicoccaceae archaeon]